MSGVDAHYVMANGKAAAFGGLGRCLVRFHSRSHAVGADAEPASFECILLRNVLYVWQQF